MGCRESSCIATVVASSQSPARVGALDLEPPACWPRRMAETAAWSIAETALQRSSSSSAAAASGFDEPPNFTTASTSSTAAAADDASPRDYTLLHHAAAWDQVRLAHILLRDHGFDPNVATWTGITPLHLATSGAMVRVLVAAGAAVNAPTDTRYTPLLWAVTSGALDAVRALLQLPATDLDARTASGRGALWLARYRGRGPHAAAILHEVQRAATTAAAENP